MKDKPIGHSQDKLQLQRQILRIEQNLLEIKEALLDSDYELASRFASRLLQRTNDLHTLLNTMSNRPPVARGYSDANEIELSHLSTLNCEISEINDELVRIKRTIESSILTNKNLCPNLTYQGYSVIMVCRRTKPTCPMSPMEAFLTFDQENRFNFNPKCWGSVVESFFGKLKTERVFDSTYLSRDDARRDIVDYIEMFYNSKRRYSSLGYLSPMEYEKLMAMKKAD